VYAPSLECPFVSDDLYYLYGNPAVREPSAAHLVEILSPRSDLARMVANYAPVHLLTHMVQWQLFGERFFGYHATNLALHALVSVLLVALFLASGIARLPALLGGAFFLLHPANVEAVAWISQVKTLVATVLMLAALAACSRPCVGTLAFALSLGSKATNAVALPVALAWRWIRGAGGDAKRRRRERIGMLAWSAAAHGGQSALPRARICCSASPKRPLPLWRGRERAAATTSRRFVRSRQRPGRARAGRPRAGRAAEPVQPASVLTAGARRVGRPRGWRAAGRLRLAGPRFQFSPVRDVRVARASSRTG
jgi:hypothetical protein